jgi:hypothetical protein
MEHACARFNASLVDFYLPASSESRGATDSTCHNFHKQNKTPYNKKKKKKNAHARMLRFATPSKTIGGYEVFPLQHQRQNHPRRATIDFRRSRFDGKVSHCRVRDGSMPRRDERRVRAR